MCYILIKICYLYKLGLILCIILFILYTQKHLYRITYVLILFLSCSINGAQQPSFYFFDLIYSYTVSFIQPCTGIANFFLFPICLLNKSALSLPFFGLRTLLLREHLSEIIIRIKTNVHKNSTMWGIK